MIRKILDLRWNPAFNFVILTLLGAGAGLVSLLLGATVFGLPLFRSYFTSPLIIFLNLLPPVLMIFLLYFISRRAWIAFTFPSLFLLVLSMVQFFKVQVRGDAFVLSDLAIVREAGAIISEYTLTMNWKIYMAIASLICGLIFSLFVLKHRPKGAGLRIIAAASIVVVSAVMYIFVYSNNELYNKRMSYFAETEWRPARHYASKGFIYPFIHNIRSSVAFMTSGLPDWYDEQAAKRMLESYITSDIPDGKKVNIISIMLEAYSDLTLLPMLKFEVDAYGPLHRLQEESVSGMLAVNTFAAGTTDAERLFLTGNTQLTTYRTPTNSYVHYLKNQGYYTEGLHAGDMWFYDRLAINKLLGFDKYYFIDDYPHAERYDWFFFPEVQNLYNSRDISKPYFSYNVSYQNHGAYDSTRTAEPYIITQGGMSDESFNILNNYLRGIYDTNKRIEGLVDSLRADPEPVVVVIYGDHKPWLGNNNSAYSELDINIDKATEEGYYNYFAVPYIIWANDAAKRTLENDFKGDGGIFSPCFLMGEVFRLCSWEGEGYMQALRELKAYVDIINTLHGMFRENGVLTEMLSPETEEMYLRFRMMEIYRRSHFAYRG